jgi:PiT family inorganic phosphate transporter
MALSVFLLLSTLFLAYANGANDNFKGVATLYGSRSVSYRTALALGTVSTFLGGLASLAIAAGLIKIFSGAGVVPAEVAASPRFLAAISAGAGVTVILATRLGLPISTTHSLLGAIIGAGLVLVGPHLNLGVVGKSFALPLIVSPIAAVALTIPLYYGLHELSRRTGLKRETCVCVDGGRLMAVSALQPVAAGAGGYASAYSQHTGELVVIASAEQCVEKYGGHVLGVKIQHLTDAAHATSAAAVSFARGLNDTPKILALLLAAKALDIKFGVLAVAVVMAIGGVLNARKVAQTMSQKISKMNDGQALAANLVTAFLVIVASRMGLPVSTTQVSVGAIAGIGVINGSANRAMLSGILASWLMTLPIAAVSGATIAFILGGLGQS